VTNRPKIEIIYEETNKISSTSATIKDELTKIIPASMLVTVTSFQKFLNESWTVQHLKPSRIFLFDSLDYFERQMRFPTSYNFVVGSLIDYDQKHIIYVPDITEEIITKNARKNYILGAVTFLMNFDNSSIELATSFYFTPEACNQNQITTINRFSGQTNQWENEDFYPEKYRDLHGCDLNVRFFEGFGNIISKRIFEELAVQMNFKVVRRQETDFSLLLVNNPNVMEVTEMIIPLSTLSLKYQMSAAIYNDAATLVVPPGKPLTDLERMFSAFDDETWIGIGLTFVVACIVISIIKLLPMTVRNFVFGLNIRNPILNLFDIFINGGQNQVPGRNFARFLLMMFVIWSLVFRTCYQSKMFESLNSDTRRPRVKTIEELQEQNFTYIYDKKQLILGEKTLG
jgi:hypothetical protein